MVDTKQVYALPAKEKRTAARNAQRYGDGAVVVGVAGVITAIIPGGQVPGVCLGIAAGSLQILANAWGRLASDPPRKDFTVLSIPVLPRVPLPAYAPLTTNTLAQAARDLGSVSTQLAEAVETFVTTLERVTGAEIAYYRGPNYALFRAVNAQRHSAQAQIDIMTHLLHAQSVPRSVLANDISISSHRWRRRECRSQKLHCDESKPMLRTVFGNCAAS
jgi:hypothetical protein